MGSDFYLLCCYFLRITFLGRFAWNVWRQLQTSAWKSKWWQLYSSTTLALATTISVGRKKAQHQEVFPWGDNCFLMIFSKPNKSLEWFCGLTAFDIPRVLLHFLGEFLVTFLHDERHLAIGHFASLVHHLSKLIWQEDKRLIDHLL